MIKYSGQRKLEEKGFVSADTFRGIKSITVGRHGNSNIQLVILYPQFRSRESTKSGARLEIHKLTPSDVLSSANFYFSMVP